MPDLEQRLRDWDHHYVTTGEWRTTKATDGKLMLIIEPPNNRDDDPIEIELSRNEIVLREQGT